MIFFKKNKKHPEQPHWNLSGMLLLVLCVGLDLLLLANKNHSYHPWLWLRYRSLSIISTCTGAFNSENKYISITIIATLWIWFFYFGNTSCFSQCILTVLFPGITYNGIGKSYGVWEIEPDWAAHSTYTLPTVLYFGPYY